MKVPGSAKREASKRVEADEKVCADLQQRLDAASRRLSDARQLRDELERQEREERSRLHSLASAVLEGREVVVPVEDTKTVARLVPELRAARAHRAHEVRVALAQTYIPLEQHEFDPAGARRRGFADPDEE
jgi:hypothetical protein